MVDIHDYDITFVEKALVVSAKITLTTLKEKEHTKTIVYAREIL